MLRTLNNIAVQVLALFIPNKERKHLFRERFKIKPPLKQLDLRTTYPDLPKVYLSAVCISKNEGPYVREWIEYHKLVGVERFYFYDNESDDDTRTILQPYIDDGTVIYAKVPGSSMQNLVYADAILRYRRQTRWLAIIDMDEFIVPIEKNSVRDFLKDYERFPAVGINWVLFDSSGHIKKPSSPGGGMVTACYTRVRKNHKDETAGEHLIKSIVNPMEVNAIYNPHYASYRCYRLAVTENLEPIMGPRTAFHSSSKIQINHYYSKSREEYIKKCKMGYADHPGVRPHNEERINFSEFEHDYSVQKYLPRLEAAMGIKQAT